LKAQISVIRINDAGLTRVIVNNVKCYDSANSVEVEKSNIKKLLAALDELPINNG
jgi:hypothetical protein